MNQKRSFAMLAGLGAQARNRTVILRKIPAIAELEALLEKPGAAWSPLFEEKCEAASLSLFGITEAETNPVEPHPDHVVDKGGSRYWMSDQALSDYNVMLDAWYDWQVIMNKYAADLEELGPVRLFGRLGYDVTADIGAELNCFEFIHRQLYVAIKELLPTARLSLNGEARRPVQSVEAWGAALAAEAARFRPSR